MVTTDAPDSEPVKRFDWTQFEELSVAVMDTMSDLLDADPLDITPLYQVIDPDSLERLFVPLSPARTQFDGAVQFEYHDHWVRIDSDGSGYIYEQVPERSEAVLRTPMADD